MPMLLDDSDSANVDCELLDIAGTLLMMVGLRFLFFLRILEKQREFKVHLASDESNLVVVASFLCSCPEQSEQPEPGLIF